MTLREVRHVPWWVNTAWMWQCRREAQAFRAATHAVQPAQERLLGALLSDNANSQFGRAHRFASIRSFDDFRSAVPISTYDALAPRIDRIARGEAQVLTTEQVLMFEPTGGSAGGSKLIPYTSSLRRQFQRAIAAWAWDVFRHRPAVRVGTAYWSISPATQREERTVGGTPVGFESDHEYLDGLQRWALSRVLVAPREVSQLHDIDNFRYATLGYLLAADDLALISVWSPTFLTTLLDALPACGERLCRDLHDGMLRLPAPGCEPRLTRLAFQRRRSRSRELANALASMGDRQDSLSRLWPNLALISCWADAAAEMYVTDLQSRFPAVWIQPKGLLATEGVVSIPIVERFGAALAIRSHVFEFLEVLASDNDGTPQSRTLLADELEMGRRYRVLLTTGGGLYRYDLGDVVEVVGFLHQCPLLQFRGRYGLVSDLVGEKLNERHVRECLRATLAEFDLRPAFALVVPQAAPPGYLALIDGCRRLDTEGMTPALARRLETRLRENPQYRYAVDLGQLTPVQIRWLDLPTGRAWDLYEDRCRKLGQKAGDIKPTALDGRPGWAEVFQ
jgi:hypothetical protein